MSDRVRIGTCSGLADAAIVRSVFTAHGINVVVGTEHHAGVFTGLGGGFVSLDIWVDADDRDDAAALLRDLREHGDHAHGDHAHQLDDDDGDGDRDGREEGDTGGDGGGERVNGESFHDRIDRRRRTAVALLLGCLVTFGTAHMFSRAWARGLVLAAIEIAGFVHLARGHAYGSIAVAVAVVADVIGAVWRIRTDARSRLPAARLHSR